MELSKYVSDRMYSGVSFEEVEALLLDEMTRTATQTGLVDRVTRQKDVERDKCEGIMTLLARFGMEVDQVRQLVRTIGLHMMSDVLLRFLGPCVRMSVESSVVGRTGGWMEVKEVCLGLMKRDVELMVPFVGCAADWFWSDQDTLAILHECGCSSNLLLQAVLERMYTTDEESAMQYARFIVSFPKTKEKLECICGHIGESRAIAKCLTAVVLGQFKKKRHLNLGADEACVLLCCLHSWDDLEILQPGFPIGFDEMVDREQWRQLISSHQHPLDRVFESNAFTNEFKEACRIEAKDVLKIVEEWCLDETNERLLDDLVVGLSLSDDSVKAKVHEILETVLKLNGVIDNKIQLGYFLRKNDFHVRRKLWQCFLDSSSISKLQQLQWDSSPASKEASLILGDLCKRVVFDRENMSDEEKQRLRYFIDQLMGTRTLDHLSSLPISSTMVGVPNMEWVLETLYPNENHNEEDKSFVSAHLLYDWASSDHHALTVANKVRMVKYLIQPTQDKTFFKCSDSKCSKCCEWSEMEHIVLFRFLGLVLRDTAKEAIASRIVGEPRFQNKLPILSPFGFFAQRLELSLRKKLPVESIVNMVLLSKFATDTRELEIMGKIVKNSVLKQNFVIGFDDNGYHMLNHAFREYGQHTKHENLFWKCLGPRFARQFSFRYGMYLVLVHIAGFTSEDPMHQPDPHRIKLIKALVQSLRKRFWELLRGNRFEKENNTFPMEAYSICELICIFSTGLLAYVVQFTDQKLVQKTLKFHEETFRSIKTNGGDDFEKICPPQQTIASFWNSNGCKPTQSVHNKCKSIQGTILGGVVK